MATECEEPCIEFDVPEERDRGLQPLAAGYRRRLIVATSVGFIAAAMMAAVGCSLALRGIVLPAIGTMLAGVLPTETQSFGSLDPPRKNRKIPQRR